MALSLLFLSAMIGASLAGLSLGVDPALVDLNEDPVFEQALYAWSLPLQAILILALVWTLLARLKSPPAQVLGLTRARNWWAVLLVLPVGLCSDRAVALLRQLVPDAELGTLGDLARLAGAEGPLGLALITGLVLWGPLSEEVLFRGFVFRGLQRDRGTLSAIGFSALLFGLFHLDPFHAVGAGVLGLYLGWLRVVCGSLVPVVLAHVLNNGVWMALVRSGYPEPVVPWWVDCAGLTVWLAAVWLTRDALR